MSTENRPLSDAEAMAEARRIIDSAMQPDPQVPAATCYVDPTPVPAYGPTPPVPQPDHRTVPPWAAGVAVASIGVGAGITGVGCGIWLVLQGLASITLASVLFVTLPIAALAAVLVAVGSVVRGVRTASAETHHHYAGPVHQEQTTTNNRWFSRSTTNR
ncbi:hypothetical protein ACWIGN_01005 [Streptomyces albidoflavus]